MNYRALQFTQWAKVATRNKRITVEKHNQQCVHSHGCALTATDFSREAWEGASNVMTVRLRTMTGVPACARHAIFNSLSSLATKYPPNSSGHTGGHTHT